MSQLSCKHKELIFHYFSSKLNSLWLKIKFSYTQIVDFSYFSVKCQFSLTKNNISSPRPLATLIFRASGVYYTANGVFYDERSYFFDDPPVGQNHPPILSTWLSEELQERNPSLLLSYIILIPYFFLNHIYSF